MVEIDPGRVSASSRHILDGYHRFLRKFKVDPRLYRIDPYVVKDVATHYWRDVERLHLFHDMPRIDCGKIAGYIVYWISRLRPIHVFSSIVYLTNPNVPKFINESFAVYIACGRLNSELTASGQQGRMIVDNKTLDSLLYSLKYRITSADALSLFFSMAKKVTSDPAGGS